MADVAYRFHLSLVARDLAQQRAFYVELLGCAPGRRGEFHADFDFFGHQLTFHERPDTDAPPYEALHFGANVTSEVFDALHRRLSAAGVQFVIEPVAQAPDSVDARRKMVFLDPNGYAIELKCYQDAARTLVDEPAYARVQPDCGSSES